MRFVTQHAAKIIMLAVVTTLYIAAAPRGISDSDRVLLARGLAFASSDLLLPDNGKPMRTIRDVHPSLRHIDAWISSVGAGVALADIDGTGRPADVCLVDPRNDSISIQPAPGTEMSPDGRTPRYAAFALPTPSEGYDPRTIAPMGCLPVDVNEDGRVDIIAYYWGRTPVVFLRNDGALAAEGFNVIEIVSKREVWNTMAAIVADIDGDGHVDIVFGNYFRDGERVLDADATTPFQMQHSMSRAENAGHKRLLLWRTASAMSVSYTDASDAFTPQMSQGWTLALAARDLDDEHVSTGGPELAPYRHLPELYIANDFGSDRLLLNRSKPGEPHFKIIEGRRRLIDPRSKVLGQDSFKGMGVDFGDVTGDGRPAIAVSNISSPYALLESHFLFVNTGDSSRWAQNEAPYRDESFGRGTWISNWAWDIKFADINNSGRPSLLQAIGFVRGERNRWPELHELAMGNDELLSSPHVWPRFSAGDDLSGHDHDRFFVPTVGGSYHDVWPQLGLSNAAVSRGIATGDVFGDGKLAIAIARQWGPSTFLRNTSTDVGQAIVLDLRVRGAVAGTRAAIGAEVFVRLPDGRIVTGVVDGGSGHGGKRAPEIHLGVGKMSRTDLFKVQIRWRADKEVRDQIVEVTPGRHTILLGESSCLNASRQNEVQEGICSVISIGQ